MTQSEKIQYLDSIESETISPTQLAKVFGGDPYTFNQMQKEGRLQFPHIMMGRNLRIFKEPIKQLLLGNQDYLNYYRK